MSDRVRIGIFVGLFVIAAVIFAAMRSREPVYQGKKLSAWLEEGASQDVPYSSSPETQIAVRQIGTNALPFLLDMLRSQDSKAKLKLRNWFNKQDLINVRFHHSEEEQLRAVGGFYLLGEIATPAIPELVEISKDTNLCFYALTALRLIGRDALPALTNATSSTNEITREFAVNALAEMGTNAESALPLLINFLADTNPRVRLTAAFSIFYVGTNQTELAVPALIKSLDDPDRKVANVAVNGLKLFGNKAKDAIPKLTELLGTRGLSGSSAFALASIMGTNQAISPIAGALTNQDVRVQGTLINALGAFQADARESVLFLIPFAQSDNEQLRRVAIQALIQIGADKEVLLPILIEELSDIESMTRSQILSALGKLGADARAAVPILIEQIKILDSNNGQFPPQEVSDQKYYSPFPFAFSLSDSEEFKALLRIDPQAANKLKKEIDENESKSPPK